MERNKELEPFNFQAFLEKRRRNREIGIKGKVDRMSEGERMKKKQLPNLHVVRKWIPGKDNGAIYLARMNNSDEKTQWMR